MRQWIVSAAAALLMTSSFAQAATPARSASAAEPAPPQGMAAADAPIKVLVAPFTEVNEQQQPDWINRAIQQSVSDELSALASVEVVPNNSGATLPSTAQAKGAGVSFIVRGTIQRLNGEIRVTGRVQSVDDGKTVGGFKATGPQSQLFAIEDSVSQQLKSVISPMEADLEDPRPVAAAPTRGGRSTTPVLRPAQRSTAGGVFEGSDLQRSLEDRDYLRRVQRRAPLGYTQPPVYYPPTQVAYPPTYPGYGGYGYGYGYGYGWDNGGDTNIVIIGGTGGGNGGGSVGGGSGGVIAPSGPPLTTVQTQRLRDAAVNPGQSGNFIGPPPARAPVTDLKRTIPK